MRWDDTYDSNTTYWRWYDLLDGNDALLGYVRESMGRSEFIAQINDRMQPTAKFDNLEDAKNHILAYYVVQKLEGT